MTQTTPDSTDTSDKKDAAKFFNTWMTTEHKDDNWDEFCLQWCKQQQKARANQVDPNCSMLCLKRPVSQQQDNSASWNPLKGYHITMFKGKEDCMEHTNVDMKLTKDDVKNEAIDDMATKTSPIKYEVDLGNVWSETEIKAKEIVNEKVIPYYNSAIEQAIGWKDSPQGVQFQNSVKDKASSLLGYVYPLSPFKVNNDSQETKDVPSTTDEKK